MAQTYKSGSKVPVSSKEAERRKRVERLCSSIPKLTTGKAMTFTAAAAREATRKAKAT